MHIKLSKKVAPHVVLTSLKYLPLIKDAPEVPSQEKSQTEAQGQTSSILVIPFIDSVIIHQIVEEVLK